MLDKSPTSSFLFSFVSRMNGDEWARVLGCISCIPQRRNGTKTRRNENNFEKLKNTMMWIEFICSGQTFFVEQHTTHTKFVSQLHNGIYDLIREESKVCNCSKTRMKTTKLISKSYFSLFVPYFCVYVWLSWHTTNRRRNSFECARDRISKSILRFIASCWIHCKSFLSEFNILSLHRRQRQHKTIVVNFIFIFLLFVSFWKFQ